MKTRTPVLIALCLGVGMLLSFNKNEADSGYEIEKNPNFTNLKILPKDISDDDLKDVMREFNMALGVKCNFCHAEGKDGKLDFASDENKHKNIARDMMKMTKGINKKYFKITDPKAFEVNCVTCHNGSKHPAKVAIPNAPPAPITPATPQNLQQPSTLKPVPEPKVEKQNPPTFNNEIKSLKEQTEKTPKSLAK